MSSTTFGLLVSSIATIVCILSKNSQVQKWLLSTSLFCTTYFIGNLINDLYPTTLCYLIGHKIIYLSTTLLGVSFLFALFELCEIKMPVLFKRGIFVVCSLSAIPMLLIDKGTHWFTHLEYVESATNPGTYTVEVSHGITYYLVNYATIGGMIIIIAYLGYKILSTKGHKNNIIKVLLIVLIFPAIVTFLSFFGIMSTTLSNNATFIGVLISIMVLQLRYDIMTTVPIAKERAIDSTTDGIIILNVHGQFLFANPFAKKLLSFINWEDIDHIQDELQNSVLGKTTLTAANGEIIEVKTEDIIDDDKNKGSIVWLIDVTEHASRIREEEKTKRITENLHETIHALGSSVDAKDAYTQGHSERVAKYSKLLAKKLGKSDEEAETIFDIAMLHDVGKIGIPDQIINKPSRLTDEEFKIIQSHTTIGYEILSKITSFPELSIGARWHHEKYNGTGYPDGLKGEEIPEIARIIGIADAYDAMSSNRSYRSALPQDVIRNEIVKNKGTQFDPIMADAWIEIMDDDTDYQLQE